MREVNNFDNGIIVRFLLGEASRQDIRLLETWTQESEKNSAYFEQIRDTWNSVEVERALGEDEMQHDLDKVLKQLDQPAVQASNNAPKSMMLSFRRLLRVAAIFIAGAIVAASLTFVVLQQRGTSAYNEVHTPRGSRTTLNLPDGSKIWLNAGSTLRYPQTFSDKSREVFLEGEAFFKVSKDKNRKFLVRTNSLTVKVFGTSFNVKSYPDENTVETTLVEGSISIYKSSTNGKKIGKEIKMEPNQQMVFYKKPSNITPQQTASIKTRNLPARKPKLVLTKKINTKPFTSWKEGQLIINSQPLARLAITLERRYDVIIHFVDDDIKQYRFTGTIENETIEQVMAAIKLAAPIDYKIEEREVWVSKLRR